MSRPRLTLVRVNERKGIHPFMEETNVTGVYPPLGVAYLAASARAAGYPAAIVDAHALNLSAGEMVQTVSRIGAEVVGITTTTFNWPVAAQLARALKKATPKVQVWVGGPQLSLYPDECMAETAVDVAVVGEGDRVVVELLQRLEAGEELAGVPGTLVRVGDQVIPTPVGAPIADLDSLPMPALGLLPLSSYRAITLPSPWVSMLTSRGCPFHCRYCSQAYVGGKYRPHGPERVVEELERAVTTFHAREVVFFDETFTQPRKRAVAIAEGILARNLKVRFNIRTRIDRLDPTVLEALAAAGCTGIHVGVEAGSMRVQKLMNKNLNLERLAGSLAQAQRLGLETRGYFMLGFPGETLAEMEQTIRFAAELPLDWASFTITTPAPGSDIYMDALDSGLIATDYWREYTLGRQGEPPGYFVSDEVDEKKLEQLLRKAYRVFYARPNLLARKARNRRLMAEVPASLRTLWDLNRPR